MANAKEIQARMKSIQDTMKITNAMYMISSSKMKTCQAGSCGYGAVLLQYAECGFPNPASYAGCGSCLFLTRGHTSRYRTERSAVLS